MTLLVQIAAFLTEIPPRSQTPFGNAPGFATPLLGGTNRRETEFRPHEHSQTKFGNEGAIGMNERPSRLRAPTPLTLALALGLAQA